MRSPRCAAAFVPILAILLSACPAHALPPGPIQFGQPTSVTFTGRGLQLAQVDGTGGPDVVSMDGGSLHVWRNTAGQLPTAPDSVLMAAGAQIISYFVADFDGDGTPDLAATTSASELIVRRGLGWPAFAVGESYALTAVANGLCSGDLDGDGRPELVASQPDSGTVIVFRNLGSGTFTQWARYVIAGPANNSWSTYPMRDVAIGECNGDSHPDVIANVHENYASREAIAVLLNHGDGSLGPAVKSLAFWGPRADLQAGDLNGDGLADAVIGSEGSAYAILLGTGGGQMALVDSIDTESNWEPARSVIVDMDGDGALDLVTGRYLGISSYRDLNSVVVWTGLGNGHFIAPAEYQAAYRLTEFVVGDLEGDGAHDIVVATRTESSWLGPDPRLWTYRGLDDGLVLGYRNLVPTGPCSDPWCYWPDLVVVAGASAQGRPADLFHSTGGHYYWRRNLGHGAMAPEAELGLGALATVRDVNHDGRADIVLALPGGVGIRLSVADGAWSADETYLGGRYFGLADIDGDGELDLAQAEVDGHMWWRRGSHEGTFGDPTWTEFLVREADPQYPEFACLGDVDSDGRADLVSVTCDGLSPARATILRLRSDGGLDTLTGFDIPPWDATFFSPETQTRPYIAQAGGGRAANLFFVGSVPGTVEFGRLNSFRREPDGTYALVSSLPTLREPQGLGIADFDLDGIEDVALTNGADIDIGSVYVYRCDENGALTEQWTAYPGTYPGIALPADFDGDSKPDLFIARRAAHRIGIFTNVTMIDQPTPTLVSLVSAQVTPEGVALDWFAPGSDAASALLERSAPAVNWTSISRLTPDGDGHYRFVDRDVVEGARYGYRLRINGADPREGDATWVSIPTRRGLQLLGVMPNPATENARVRFMLPRETEVRIEVLDILGRRRGASPPTRLSAGTHELPIPSRGRLAPGVYLLRLSAGGETLTRRFAATR